MFLYLGNMAAEWLGAAGCIYALFCHQGWECDGVQMLRIG